MTACIRMLASITTAGKSSHSVVEPWQWWCGSAGTGDRQKKKFSQAKQMIRSDKVHEGTEGVVEAALDMWVRICYLRARQLTQPAMPQRPRPFTISWYV